jgi:hypothetical protein
MRVTRLAAGLLIALSVVAGLFDHFVGGAMPANAALYLMVAPAVARSKGGCFDR